jgi:hypothetical protein
MDPLIVARCIGKAVNLLLGDLVPVANANLGANRGLEILEVVKDAHLPVSFPVHLVLCSIQLGGAFFIDVHPFALRSGALNERCKSRT